MQEFLCSEIRHHTAGVGTTAVPARTDRIPQSKIHSGPDIPPSFLTLQK